MLTVSFAEKDRLILNAEVHIVFPTVFLCANSQFAVSQNLLLRLLLLIIIPTTAAPAVAATQAEAVAATAVAAAATTTAVATAAVATATYISKAQTLNLRSPGSNPLSINCKGCIQK